MKLEFKVYQLKEESRMYKRLITDANNPNEFIIIGEEKLSEDFDCYKVQQLDEKGITLIGGLTLDDFTFLIEKKDLELKSGFGCKILEVDVPKEYLTIEIIENIQRLNAWEEK